MISCKLTSPELQKYKTEVISLLKSEVLQRKELDNGYQYSFDGSDKMIDHIINFIKSESACCDFFTFNLSVEDVNRNVVLIITGPEGAKEFINAEMEL
ncbi:MAG: hypothetical protein ABI863_21335 [Ginsengibacter sp.]